jgi:hypothetical protein
MQPTKARDHGNALIIMLVFLVIVAGVSTPMLLRSAGSRRATTADVTASRLLFTAEAGLNYNYSRMELDPRYAARDTAGFSWDASAREFVSGLLDLTSTGAATEQMFQYRLQYLTSGAPITFADRANPIEAFDGVRVTCSVAAGQITRTVVARYRYGIKDFGGAVISDMTPIPGGGTGKSKAKLGHVVLASKGRDHQHAIFGNIRANGQIQYDAVALNETNVGTYLLASSGKIEANLGGTPDEVPDFTSLGGTDQLFDFDRFEAAAAAGAGAVHSTLANFVAAMNLANSMGQPLEGIHVVRIDPAVAGGSPKPNIPGGINVTGTLVFRFVDGTDPSYKVVLEMPVRVNAADLTSVNFANQGTYTTGYPGTYADPSKKPDQVDITPAFQNFTATSDYPAVMFNNGIVDFHGPVNVSGVVYGPSFIEIENKAGNVQFVNGAVIGGGGIYLEGHDSAGVTAIRYDYNTIDQLETMGNKGQTLIRQSFAIVR